MLSMFVQRSPARACPPASALLGARVSAESQAALAQLVEHIIRNDGVRCSSHLSGTTFSPGANPGWAPCRQPKRSLRRRRWRDRRLDRGEARASPASGSACSPAATRSAWSSRGAAARRAGRANSSPPSTPRTIRRTLGEQDVVIIAVKAPALPALASDARAADRAAKRSSCRCSTACRGGSSTASRCVGRSRRQHRRRASVRRRSSAASSTHRAAASAPNHISRQACRQADHRRAGRRDQRAAGAPLRIARPARACDPT